MSVITAAVGELLQFFEFVFVWYAGKVRIADHTEKNRENHDDNKFVF